MSIFSDFFVIIYIILTLFERTLRTLDLRVIAFIF